MSAATVADLSERQLIARIQARLPSPPAWMLVGIGDDAAVVEPEKNRVDVLSVDALIEGVHFDRAFVPPDAIGHRALAVNVSDLAAMGAQPRLALISMAIPPVLPLVDFDGIVAGLTALAAQERMHIAGGNLSRSPAHLMIDVTVVGTLKRRQALTRAGARPGDEVYVSGVIGAAAAGLRALKTRTSSKSLSTAEDTGDTEDESRRVRDFSSVSTVSSVVTHCVERYLRPEPRVRLGVWLGRNRVASACIDLSDGLADGVHQIAEASGVGMVIDPDSLPIDAATRQLFGARGKDATREAIAGGDDYELLFTVHPRLRRRLIGAARHAGIPLTRIGTCTDTRAVVLRQAGVDTPLLPGGYSHFGSG